MGSKLESLVGFEHTCNSSISVLDGNFSLGSNIKELRVLPDLLEFQVSHNLLQDNIQNLSHLVSLLGNNLAFTFSFVCVHGKLFGEADSHGVISSVDIHSGSTFGIFDRLNSVLTKASQSEEALTGKAEFANDFFQSWFPNFEDLVSEDTVVFCDFGLEVDIVLEASNID